MESEASLTHLLYNSENLGLNVYVLIGDKLNEWKMTENRKDLQLKWFLGECSNWELLEYS